MSDWSLSEHITDHFTKPRLGNLRPPALWPSEASAIVTDDLGDQVVTGACRRAVFFRYLLDKYKYNPAEWARYDAFISTLKEKRLPTDKYMQWIWAAGNLFEDFVVEQAKASGVFIEGQTQVVIPEINLVGKLDLVVINPDNNRLIGTEIKSVYGHQAKDVLGSPSSKKYGKLGKPRTSNLMQAALYEYHLKKSIADFDMRLFYGARDTGVFAEYSVETKYNSQTQEHEIFYHGVAPIRTSLIKSPITIENIIKQYNYIESCLQDGTLPFRDYTLAYSDEYIKRLYEANLLSKTNKEAYEKIEARKEENKELIRQGKKPKKELKPLELGDWRCENCNWRDICYNEDKQPIL